MERRSCLVVVVLAVVGLLGASSFVPTWAEGHRRHKKEHASARHKKERKVRLNQVPEAARKKISQMAGNNRVKKIEMKTRGGKTIYEAEWVVDQKEIEIKVSEDGKLLDWEVDDADEEDEDEDEDHDDDEDDDD